MPEIFEKWGFGMAPPKAQTRSSREASAAIVIAAASDSAPPPWSPRTLDAISETKGMFMRVFRMDQWDWFNVCGQLGYPSRGLAKAIGEALADLRAAACDGDQMSLRMAQKRLCEMPARRCLRAFLGELAISDEPGAGWVYILSTRSEPSLLKIGMTMRTVQERAREINGATGVAVPYGVRRCWRVSDPVRAEGLVHKALTRERLRGDREFFRIDFFEAEHQIQVLLREHGLELRTLGRLAALGEPVPIVPSEPIRLRQ